MKSSTSVISNAKSIAQSTVSSSFLTKAVHFQASQVEVKLRTNQTKAQLRTLMKNIDTGKQWFKILI